MKYLKLLAVSTLSLTLLTACGNKDVFQTDYTFKKAIVKLPNGEVVEGEVEEWTAYDDKDMVKVKFKDGKQYLGHSSNIVLYND